MAYISLQQAIGSSGNKDIKTIYDVFNLAIQMKLSNDSLMEVTKTLRGLSNKNKLDELTNTEYITAEASIIRNYQNDRRFPLETVKLKSMELEHNEDIKEATIHTGSYADEFARSLHALAFTVGTDIYFRNGAYKPESEEGRKLLAHELKHVAQYEENPSEDNRTKKELEEEAVKEERKEVYEADPLMSIDVSGRKYNLRQSKVEKFNQLAEHELEEWVEMQKTTMSESEYLEFLIKYKEYLEQRV